MITHTLFSIFIRNQKYLKPLLTYQRRCNLQTTVLLQYQDVQDSSTAASSSVFTFDSSLDKLPHKSTDILEARLFKAKTAGEVLQLAGAHSSIMNSGHISTAFSHFHNFMKDKSKEELRSVMHNQDFLQLCKRAVKIAQFLTPNEAITIFKTLGFLNVPSTANVMQVLCQVIRRNINSLPLDQIVFLIFLLQKQQPTPLVDALLIALPLVLQSQLDLQMDSENINEMARCLQVATTRKLSDATVQKLSDAILLKADKLTAYSARIIIASLVPDRQFPDSYEQLVYKALDILACDIGAITDKEAMMLLSKLHKTNYFSRSFLEAVVRKAIERKWDLMKLSQLLIACEKHEFVSEDLLEYTICEMHLHETELGEDHRISLTNIIGCFSLVGYESKLSKRTWTAVRNFQHKLEMLGKKSPMLFLKFNSDLSVLGCCPLPSLFEDSILLSISENVKKGKMKFAQELSVIEWVTKILDTNYNGPYLPEYIVQDVINRIWDERQKKNFFLEPFLKVGLGGEQFFETNLITKYGHTIDHIVILRKGDYPVAVERNQDGRVNSEDIKFAEDLVAPPESKMLAIITADESCYCKSSSQLKGWMKIQLQTLSKLGYLPFLINAESWKCLLNHEKIPYLMREMKEILKQSEQEIVVDAYPALN